MPQDASAIEREPYDRVWVLGDPHIGKSTLVVSSAAAAFGPGYVINCGKKQGLLEAARRTKGFKWDQVHDEAEMEAALKEARRGCKDGNYKWICIDDLNLYGSWLEEALEDSVRNEQGKADGRKWWRVYKQRLRNIILRCFEFKGHFYVVSHYIEDGGQLIDGQTEKSGKGILPLLGGTARKEIPGMFSNIVYLAQKTKEPSKRSFFINPEGVFGPSCLSVSGTREIDPDVGVLHEELKKGFEEFKRSSKTASLPSTTSRTSQRGK